MTVSKSLTWLVCMARTGLALLLAATLLSTTLLVGAEAEQKQKVKPQHLTEEQRILHVLNRLGFGARPGDVERVKSIGLENYIEQQLNPDRISDPVAELKVKHLSTLTMTTAQLYEKYPQPGQILRQLERQGELPADLGAGRQNRGKVNSSTPQSSKQVMGNDETSKSDTSSTPAPDAPARNNEEYRRAIRDYYLQNGLQQPQRITAELQASRILRAVYSERQLQEVLVDFWTNHFNVFVGKGADRWLLVSYDRDTIRPNTLGKFRDLLLATAQSPAMLFYLDNFQSVSPRAQTQRPVRQRRGLFGFLLGNRRETRMEQQQGEAGKPSNVRPAAQRQRRGINENYARELMELHSLGVDGGYTQKDVQEVARCFTGWTIFAPRGGGIAGQAIMSGPRAERLRENVGTFFFNPRAHDDGEKVVLGQKIPAGGGMQDGFKVIDILARHPSTAKFISTKLARYFVTDTPSPALIDRTAATFTRTEGDIQATLETIFSSPEFNSTEAYRAKIKRPFELAISAMRTLGADTNGGPGIHQWIARMGEPLYGYQTPNGYSDTAESWVNTGGLLERLNFGLTLASNRIPGTRVDFRQFVGASVDAESVDEARVMDQFLKLIVAGEVSPNTRQTLLKQLNQEMALAATAPAAESPNAPSMTVNRGRRRSQELARVEANISDPVTKIVGLILGSPEFQRQ